MAKGRDLRLMREVLEYPEPDQPELVNVPGDDAERVRLYDRLEFVHLLDSSDLDVEPAAFILAFEPFSGMGRVEPRTSERGRYATHKGDDE